MGCDESLEWIESTFFSTLGFCNHSAPGPLRVRSGFSVPAHGKTAPCSLHLKSYTSMFIFLYHERLNATFIMVYVMFCKLFYTFNKSVTVVRGQKKTQQCSYQGEDAQDLCI